jgi:hypothetical protein
MNEHDYEKTDEGMFINTNDDEYTRFTMRRKAAHDQVMMRQKIEHLEKEITEIKKLLQKHLVG